MTRNGPNTRDGLSTRDGPGTENGPGTKTQEPRSYGPSCPAVLARAGYRGAETAEVVGDRVLVARRHRVGSVLRIWPARFVVHVAPQAGARASSTPLSSRWCSSSTIAGLPGKRRRSRCSIAVISSWIWRCISGSFGSCWRSWFSSLQPLLNQLLGIARRRRLLRGARRTAAGVVAGVDPRAVVIASTAAAARATDVRRRPLPWARCRGRRCSPGPCPPAAPCPP